MRILVVCQHYWPEPFNLDEICEELVRRGHQVTVLTGFPNYPSGKFYEGYCASKRFCESHNGVSIIRVPIVARGESLRSLGGAAHRAANYASFWVSGNREASRIPNQYDVVLAYQMSPITMADPAIKFGREHGIKVLLYCCDLWPEDLLTGGVKKNSAPYRYCLNLSKRIYGAADSVAITSPMFKNYFKEVLEIDPSSFLVLPQYAEDIFLNKTVGRPSSFDPKRLNIVFAGNVGNNQKVENVVTAASLLDNDSLVTFHIIGSGSDLKTCQDMAEAMGLDNIVFHGRRPLSAMPLAYHGADALLLLLRKGRIINYTLPRKMSSYLASGRPVIGSVAGESARIIRDTKCGIVCPCENPEELAKACSSFEKLDKEERDAMGKRARDYYEKHLDKALFYDSLEAKLKEMTR